jgi:hypothetical protein
MATSYLKPAIFAGVALVGLLFAFSGTAKADPVPPPPPPPPPGPPKPSPTACPAGQQWNIALGKCVSTTDGLPNCGGTVKGRAPGVSMSIRTAQAALNKAYGSNTLAVDDVYGPGTRDGLLKFQNAQGLPMTGCLDAATAQALQPYVAASNTQPWVEIRNDQNGIPWKLTNPAVGVFRGERQMILETATGNWIDGYPGETPVLEGPSRDVLWDRITTLADGYGY